ncbi:MAG: nitroreductase family protein [Oscillospiraceae bacterium]|nr:nitroreductase family protein [Oscillospiraceae bacterium]
MNEVIHTLISRRSCKQYAAKQVEEAALQEILTAGMYAANGLARQAGKIIVVQNEADILAMQRMNGAVFGNPDAKTFYGAPTVCVVLAQADAPTAVEDGALVIGNMMAAASSLGVGSCWVHRAREVFASDEGKALLQKWGVTGEYIGVGNCLLGYAAAPPKPAAPRKADFVTRV